MSTRHVAHTGAPSVAEAHQLLAAIVESSDDAIVSKTLEGIIQSWNPAAERIFGYTADEVIGKSIRIIIPPDRQHEEDEVLNRVIHGERVHHFETVRVRKDGRQILISLTVSPVRDSAGNVVGASKVARDITETRATEQAIRQSEEQFRTLTSLAPVGIFTTDPAGNCTFVNDRWQALSGVSEADAMGDGWVRGLHPDDIDRVAGEWHRAAEAGIDFVSEYRFRKEDDVIVWVQGRAAALKSDDGEVTGYLGTITDISELKRAQFAREEFLGLMSHELRTPITTVYGSSRLLELKSHHISAEDRAELARDIRDGAERLNRMIEDLLVMARLDAGRVGHDEPLLLAPILNKVAGSFRDANSDREFAIEVGPGLPMVTGQSGLIEHVLSNILGNAVKYTPPETPVTISAAVQDDEVCVAISDQGPGIESGEERRIFDQFYRSSRSTARSGGAGLGLTVCRRLIEAQGGRIWAEANEGGGLRISFTLPVMAPDPA